MKRRNILIAFLLGSLGLYGCSMEADESTAVTEQTVSQTEEDTVSYSRSEEYEAQQLEEDAVIEGGAYLAEETDESALAVGSTAEVSVTGALLKKTDGDASSADASSFQGVNAAVRAYDQAVLTLTDCVIEAEAENATGVFAYDGSTIYISDSTVNVSGGGAGGIQVAGGGTLYATDLVVNSASKAAVRSDRGGGLLVVEGGTYTSTGKNGCPAVYSTADIRISEAELVSENSRAVIIEGKNSVYLEDCSLSGNDQSTKEGSVRANVLLYQSASGDASEGTSRFTMKGGEIVSQSGAMFYCTNTAAVIDLQEAELVLSEDGTLLIVSAGRWGKDGKNGGDCVLNAVDQTLAGDILVDSISSLQLDLSGSSYTGAISGEGEVAVTLEEGSSWTLTGDSYITSFSGDPSSINTNGCALYVNGSVFSA